MSLQLTQEEHRRLQKQLHFSSNCSKAHYKVPDEKAHLIIQNYRAGQSIRSICKNFHIGRNTFYRIRDNFEVQS